MHTAEKIIDKISKNFPGFRESFPEIITTRRSTDGTVKVLFEFEDRSRVESVIMPFHRRDTVCLSTQVGCAMGCTFCKTGSTGFFRHLTGQEIAAQYMSCYQWIIDERQKANIPKPNIVFMGEGEGLHNFEGLKTACSIFLAREGVYLGPRQITLSSAGYLPGLRRMTELPSINFALSLHSAFHEKRLQLIPLEKKYPLEEIIPVLEKLPLKKNQFINLEYLLIKDFNDRSEDADGILQLTTRFKAIVNIIPLNPIEGLIWKAPDEKTVSDFKEMLVARDVRTMVRISRGQDIDAACGQLKGSSS